MTASGAEQLVALCLIQRPLLGIKRAGASDRDGRKADFRSAHSISSEAFTFNALASFSTMVIVGLRAARSMSLT